jgi:hypothetical protein
MEFNFAGGSYETFSKDLNAQECVNFYNHVDQEGGVSKLSLRGTPGLKVWTDTGHYAEVRGTEKFATSVYAVVGNKVFQINASKVVTECSGTLDTVDGEVSMSKNLTQVIIVDGVSGYIVTGTTVSKVAFLANATTVANMDGYFIVTFLDSATGNVSGLNNGFIWDTTWDFNTSGDDGNDTIAVIVDHRDVFMLSEKSFAVWYNNPATEPPISRKPGTTQEMGLGAKHSVVQLDNTIFYLTDKHQVSRLNGYSPAAISTRSVEYQISQYAKKDDAIGMGITLEGNAFYILTFPTANETWCYNVASTVWNKLSSYPAPYDNRWRGNCYVNFDDKHIIGDYKNGILYELDFDTFTDNSETIKRTRIPSAIISEGINSFHHRLEVFFESGVGLITGQGSDPMAMLQYSNDGGHTWSSQLWRSAGKIGKYEQRAIWNRLGASRHRNYKLTVTDPVKWVITRASLEVEPGVT